jgi:soluble lytic murein transglycosylase-like protein
MTRRAPLIRLASAPLLLAAVLGAAPAYAAVGAVPDPRSCLTWTGAVEEFNHIPPGLLVAISFVESDYDGLPWPWTLNIGGRPVYLATRQEAANLMRDREGRIRLDVAVGCMQILMAAHARLFVHPEDLLEPRLNVAYAGWYLASLHGLYGSWAEAVAHYGAKAGAVRAQRGYICKVIGYRIRLGYQPFIEAVARLCGVR